MFKERLKELRKKAHLTQEDLAKILGVERSSIGKYEGNSNVMPSNEVLNKIADYFCVSTDYLLGRDEPRVALSRPNGYDDLTDEEREQIDRLIELFRGKKY